jgi:hypothetical protein
MPFRHLRGSRRSNCSRSRAAQPSLGVPYCRARGEERGRWRLIPAHHRVMHPKIFFFLSFFLFSFLFFFFFFWVHLGAPETQSNDANHLHGVEPGLAKEEPVPSASLRVDPYARYTLPHSPACAPCPRSSRRSLRSPLGFRSRPPRRSIRRLGRMTRGNGSFRIKLFQRLGAFFCPLASVPRGCRRSRSWRAWGELPLVPSGRYSVALARMP